ncbi:MAG: CaiB/BaiF CoA transferase family protein [Micromonosporaceae bacterium]
MLPLTGVRILDLTRALSGPLCTTVLADLGADVVKVEPMPHGDVIRLWGPYHDDVSVYHLAVNRNKRSVAIDLRAEEGRALLHQLAQSADVLVENFRPGVLDALGLSEAERARAHPDLIVASVTGFGPVGPRRTDPGYDQIAQGMAGLMAVTGGPTDTPMRVGIPIADVLAGLFCAIGVLGSLHGRGHSASVNRVETSLLESAAAVMTFQAQRFLSLGEVPAPQGNHHPILAPYGVFATADRPINIAAASERQWRALAAVAGLEHLADEPAFATAEDRRLNRDRLTNLLEERLAQAGHAHWLERLRSVGVPCGPIHTMDSVFNDEQVAALGLASPTTHPTLGRVSLVRGPLWLNGQAQQVRRHPPRHGEHTDEVLAELGIDAERRDELRSRAVIAIPRGDDDRC